MAQRLKRPEANASAVMSMRSALAILESLADVTYFHVPAHVGIFPNEVVDYLAKRGAHDTTSNSPPDPDKLNDIENGVEVDFGPLPATDNVPTPSTSTPTQPNPSRRSTRTPKPISGLFDGVRYRH